MAAVTDPADLRVLIPRVRRMIDGPAADAAASGSLTDSQMLMLIADAAAEISFLTGGTWGYRLIPGDPEGEYLEAASWTVEPQLSPDSATIVCVQAALGYLYRLVSTRKVSEEMKDEGSSWSYTVSATILRDWLKSLQAQRDAALEQLAAAGVATDTYFSLVTVRDSAAGTAIEPLSA